MSAPQDPVSHARPTADAPVSGEASAAAAPTADGVASHGRPTLLAVRDLSKAFPGVQALSGVSMSLTGRDPGPRGRERCRQVHAHQDPHRPVPGGQRHRSSSPVSPSRSARRRTPSPVASRSCPRSATSSRASPSARTSSSTLHRRTRGLIDYDKVLEDAQHWLDLLELDVDPRTPVTRLSVAQMQLVEIARALSHEGRILLLDEPTASITPHETTTLFRVLRRLRDHGVGMVFVSHKLEEVFELCDPVTVLRDGRNVGPQRPTGELTRDDVITLMVGHEAITRELPARQSTKTGTALELRGVSTAWGAHDIDLKVDYGEIVGLYGLVGAGRTELARAIIGADEIMAGEVLVAGQAGTHPAASPTRSVTIASATCPRTARKRVSSSSTRSSRTSRSPCGTACRTPFGWITTATRRRPRSEPMVERLDIKAPSLNTVVSSLSGGNQQKVSLAKWLTAGRGRPHHRRAHRGHRRPHQGQPARAHLGAGGPGSGRAAHLERHARDGPPGRPHRGHARRSASSASSTNDRVYDDTSQRIMSFIQSVDRPSSRPNK